MIYKSYCSIDIEYYPFDIQECYMKFGTWTFNGNLINLEHINTNKSMPVSNPIVTRNGISTKIYTVEMGIDMSDYYQSVEWDVLSIPAQKNVKYYDCCAEPFHDIFFNITIRRKALFYTVNLIIPCVNISFLSVLVFYLPSSSGEKIALGIYVLVALLVFYLLLIELIPPTSLVIPLLGKYLLFTLILVNLSIFFTIFILNLHHRKPSTHRMPIWMRRVFIEILPKFLMIERPTVTSMNFFTRLENQYMNKKILKMLNKEKEAEIKESRTSRSSNTQSLDNYKNAILGVRYIHERMRKTEEDKKVIIIIKFKCLAFCFKISFKYLFALNSNILIEIIKHFKF